MRLDRSSTHLCVCVCVCVILYHDHYPYVRWTWSYICIPGTIVAKPARWCTERPGCVPCHAMKWKLQVHIMSRRKLYEVTLKLQYSMFLGGYWLFMIFPSPWNKSFWIILIHFGFSRLNHLWGYLSRSLRIWKIWKKKTPAWSLERCRYQRPPNGGNGLWSHRSGGHTWWQGPVWNWHLGHQRRRDTWRDMARLGSF